MKQVRISHRTRELVRRRLRPLRRLIGSYKRSDSLYIGSIIQARKDIANFRIGDIDSYISGKRSNKSIALRFIAPVLFISATLAVPGVPLFLLGPTTLGVKVLSIVTLAGANALSLNMTRKQLIIEDVQGHLATQFKKIMKKVVEDALDHVY